MVNNPAAFGKILVRATNWLGDAVMSLPALNALHEALPGARITVVARPWVADLYAREGSIDRVIPYPKQKGLRSRLRFAAEIRAERFDAAILFQNAFDAALMAWLARIPARIGYDRDGRGALLTSPVPAPESSAIPRHERFYYLELLRRAGLIDRLPDVPAISLGGGDEARKAGALRLAERGIAGPAIGISPGAAYGDAKRWFPERFAEAAKLISCSPRFTAPPAVLVFGSSGERELCQKVAGYALESGLDARNLAGETSLREFIDLAAACRLYLTNDSGAMHIASALGVPTVAVFGATDDGGTGPTGSLARVVRGRAACSPCLLRECPIDHRCMARVAAAEVADAALQLLEEPAPAWIPEPRS